MRNTISAILALALSMMPWSAWSSEDDSSCKKTIVTLKAVGSYMTWRDLGENPEDPSVDSPHLAVVLERYFVGDPIQGRLYIGSGCTEAPLSREDLASVPVCLSVEVFSMERDRDGKYHPVVAVDSKPIARGSLRGLRLDDRDPLNVINRSKTRFRMYKSHFEGLNTEYFDLSGITGMNLADGSYALKIGSDEKRCDYQVLMNKSMRWIRILEPDTPKLKAHKMCREAQSVIKTKPNDLLVMERAMREKIFPALEIAPDSFCALGHLANYYRKARNRAEFEKYYRASCEAQANKRFRYGCLESLKPHLDNWNNPKWR